MVNPNTKGFDHFTDEAFYYGWCENCGLGVALTDKEEVRNEILEKYHRFKKENACEPHYANCRIVQRDSGQVKDVRIMLSPDTGMADDGIFFYCHTLERLIGLSVPGRESFTLTECFGFALLTDREKMERQVFKHEADGKPVIVTGREVLLFYGEHYGIRPEELKQYATEYCCHIKHYREYGYPLLDRSLVKKMLEEEERITKGETRSFTLRIHFPWHVKITKEDNPEYAPYRYALNAYCLDNPQCFNRRYTTLEKALLHCLNGFNENAAIKDRYRSIGEYLLHMNNNDEKYSEIVNASQELGIVKQVSELIGDNKVSILKEIKDKFIIGNPRVWWLSFKKKPLNYVFDDEFQYKRIVNFFNKREICYFITELDDLHIFKTSIGNIINIINECSFFEYYIVDLNLTKLLCETDHGDLLFIDDMQ